MLCLFWPTFKWKIANSSLLDIQKLIFFFFCIQIVLKFWQQFIFQEINFELFIVLFHYFSVTIYLRNGNSKCKDINQKNIQNKVRKGHFHYVKYLESLELSKKISNTWELFKLDFNIIKQKIEILSKKKKTLTNYYATTLSKNM